MQPEQIVDPEAALKAIDDMIAATGGRIAALQEALAGRVDGVIADRQQGVGQIKKKLNKTVRTISTVVGNNVQGIANTLLGTADSLIAPRYDAQDALAGRLAVTGGRTVGNAATTMTMTAPRSAGINVINPRLVPPLPPPVPPPSGPLPPPVPTLPPPIGPIPTTTFPPLTGSYQADPDCLPSLQVDGQLGGTFPNPPDTANLPAGMDRWYIWTNCNPPPFKSQSHVLPTSNWIFLDPITGLSPAQTLIDQGYVYLGYLNIGLSNQATQFPLALQIISDYLQCACNPSGGPPPPPTLPPTLPPVPPTVPIVPVTGTTPPPCVPCPTPAPPAPPTNSGFPPFPVLQCTQLQNGQLPQVGSLAWCDCIEAVLSWLDAVGQWAATNIIPTDAGNNIASWMRAADGFRLSLGPVQSPTNKLIDYADVLADKIESINDGFATAIAQFAVVTGSKLIGLAFVKALVNLFHQFRLGWDIAIWGTLDISIRLDPLEKLLIYVENYAFQYEIPSVGESEECYLLNTATVEQVKCWMACHGANFDVYTPVILSRREKLQDEELIQWARRHDLSDVDTAILLRGNGWIVPSEAAAKVELYDELPTISDHLHWLQRNVFDSQYVTDYSLLDGFDTDANIQALGSQYAGYSTQYPSGRNFWDAFGHDLRALGMRQEYAALHYAAHWVNPAAGQLAEMMQRLRPGEVDQSVQFSEADYLRVLGEQDVAPYFRKRFLEISYRVWTLRLLNSSIQQGRLTRDQVVAACQDMGYKRDIAETMADTLMVQAARQVASAGHGFTAAVVAELVPDGLIDRARADAELKPQGFTDGQISLLFEVAQLRDQRKKRDKYEAASLGQYAKLAISAYGSGAATEQEAFNALTNAGYPDEAANLELRSEDLRQRWKALAAAVKSVHFAFTHGELDAQGATDALTAANVAADRIPNYVTVWQLEMTIPHIVATKGEILRWARKGIISIPSAITRLQNLGVSADDINLSMLELQQTIAQAQSALAARQAKELANVQAAGQRVVAASQKKLCRLFTPSKLVRWFSESIIDENTMRYRMTLCGYTQEQIDNLVAEAKIAKVKVDAAKAKAAAGPKAKPVPHLAAGRLKALYAERIIDVATLQRDLQQLGYEPDAITQLIEDAEVARAKKDAAAKTKGPAGIEYTGPGSDTR